MSSDPLASESREDFENVHVEEELEDKTEYDTGGEDAVIPQASLSSQVRDSIWSFCLANSVEPFTRVSDQIFVILTYVIGTENLFRFPLISYGYGGVLFLIPYLLCIALIGFPLMFIESVLGQYTSLPPLLMFRRLGPAFSGIGWIMTLLVCAKALFFAFRPVWLLFALQPLLALIHPSMTSTGCAFQGRQRCFDPQRQCVGNMVYQMNGICYSDPADNIDATWNDTVLIMTTAAEPLRKLHPEIYADEYLLKYEGLPMTLVMASAALQDGVAAMLATYGIRTFVKVSRLLVFGPVIAVSFVGIYSMVMIGKNGTLESIKGIMAPDWNKFFHIRLISAAALQTMLSLNVADGTTITISAMKNFRNNFFRDIFIIILVDLLVSVLACIFIPPVVGYFAVSMYPSRPIKEATKVVLSRRDFDKLFMENSAALFGDSVPWQIVHSLLCISVFLITIGLKYIAYETLVMSIWHFFPQLTRFDRRVTRPYLCSIIFFGSFTYTFFVCSAKKTRTYHLNTKIYIMAAPLIGLLEMIILVYFYKLKRLSTNIRTMIGASTSKLFKDFGRAAGLYWYAMLVVVTPLCCVYVTLTETYAVVKRPHARLVLIVSLVTLVTLILVAFLVELFKGYRRGWKMSSLFVPQEQWGPALHEDRKQAHFQEKAARVV